MADTQINSLWILLEGKKGPRHLRNLSLTTDTDPDLSDLALQLGQNLEQLDGIDVSDLEFLDSDRAELPSDTTLRVMEQNTSATKPLVVRYPLSETTVVVNLRSFKNEKVTEIRLRHTTGLWPTLLAQSRKTHERLQEGDTKIYFVDQETERNICDEFTFNDLVREKLESDGPINFKLAIRIQGKMPYGDWGIKDMLREILRDRYTSIDAIPQLDMRHLGTGDVLNEQEAQSFTSNLKKMASAFSMKVSNNGATARNFIIPFMVEAVAKVKSDYPLLALAIEQDFEGSRGYGFLDYITLYQDLAIVITDASMTGIQKGIVQNIVQLHTAAEKRNLKRKRDQITKLPVVYGIVSTAKEWVFLRWSGTPEEPTLEISKEYDVSFDGDLPGTKDVLSIIIQILRAQASALAPSAEVTGQDVEERPTQKSRLE